MPATNSTTTLVTDEVLHPIGKIQPLLIGWNLPDEVESMLVGEWVWVSTEVTWVLSGVVATDSRAELVDVGTCGA